MIQPVDFAPLLSGLFYVAVYFGGCLLLMYGASNLNLQPRRGHTTFWLGGSVIGVTAGLSTVLPNTDLPTALLAMVLMTLLACGVGYSIVLIDSYC